jgi:hypothetical protein
VFSTGRRRRSPRQDHHEVGDHGRLALVVELDDAALGDLPQGHVHQPDGAGDDGLPRGHDRRGLLAAEQSASAISGA